MTHDSKLFNQESQAPSPTQLKPSSIRSMKACSTAQHTVHTRLEPSTYQPLSKSLQVTGWVHTVGALCTILALRILHVMVHVELVVIDVVEIPGIEVTPPVGAVSSGLEGSIIRAKPPTSILHMEPLPECRTFPVLSEPHKWLDMLKATNLTRQGWHGVQTPPDMEALPDSALNTLCTAREVQAHRRAKHIQPDLGTRPIQLGYLAIVFRQQQRHQCGQGAPSRVAGHIDIHSVPNSFTVLDHQVSYICIHPGTQALYCGNKAVVPPRRNAPVRHTEGLLRPDYSQYVVHPLLNGKR
mmetsp:Transcript_19914/g.43352  ORF Transcript_19914/g.43352 Transcript_19914/m.43352 type:complete len:297 (-) Transcript_19914:1091-1981(-)